jgi:hypothetical protein
MEPAVSRGFGSDPARIMRGERVAGYWLLASGCCLLLFRRIVSACAFVSQDGFELALAQLPTRC